MSERDYPLIPEELRAIADRLEEINERLIAKDEEVLDPTDWRMHMTVDILSEDGEVLGQVKAYGDGWFGFYPKEVNA